MIEVERMIQEICPNGVEYKALSDCCVILDNKRKPITKSARISGEYPYYGANGIQDYVSDFIFEGTFVLVGEDGSVLTANGNPVVNWAEGKIWVNNHAHIIAEKEGVLLRYLYHYLQTVNISHLVHGNIPKLTGSDFKAIQIPLPPLAAQREIVRVLDKFTLLSQELAAELAARKAQYEFYRDKLLSFNDLTKNGGGYELNYPLRAKIGDFCQVLRGKRLTKDLLDDNEQYPVYHGGLEPLGYYHSFNRNGNTVMVINVGASAGTVGYCKERFWSSDGCYCLEVPNDVNSRYLYHFLMTKQHDLVSKVRRAGIPTLDAKVVENIEVLIPHIDIQNRIVEILDNFDNICSDFKIGLPAEIEKRQQQYEYYRDKLLTFNYASDTIFNRQTDRQTDRQG